MKESLDKWNEWWQENIGGIFLILVFWPFIILYIIWVIIQKIIHSISSLIMGRDTTNVVNKYAENSAAIGIFLFVILFFGSLTLVTALYVDEIFGIFGVIIIGWFVYIKLNDI